MSWYPGSGASHHVTPLCQNIQQQDVYEGPGQGLKITSSVSSLFSSPFNSSNSVALQNLLHVPTITKNFMSLTKLAKDDRVFFNSTLMIVL